MNDYLEKAMLKIEHDIRVKKTKIKETTDKFEVLKLENQIAGMIRAQNLCAIEFNKQLLDEKTMTEELYQEEQVREFNKELINANNN